MNTISLIASQTASMPASHVDLVPACGCGQDLDRCRGDYCPRCGCTLQHAAHHAAVQYATHPAAA